MKLYDILKGVCKTSFDNIEITKISSDSREELGEGSLFVCLVGKSFDAHSFIPELAKKGVSVFVTQRDCGLPNQIIVDDTRAVLPLLWANYYGNPQNELKFIGVTGTNGKTTITTVFKNMLAKMGIKAGLIGTCQNEIGDRVIPTERTTPEPNEFFALLREMADENCEWVVMEVSSQGLEQKRLGDVDFELAVFTNLTQDHLDVHGSMENYYQAKKLLFARCKQALINIDDEWGKRYFNEITCPKKSYAVIDDADFTADGIKLFASGSQYWYSDSSKTFKTNIALPGMYNVANTVAVLAGLEMLGFKPNTAVPLISQVAGVRGRCEIVPTSKDFTVVIDYAHTPDAIENILNNVKEGALGRIVCLFGCGGNRDAKKRPLMAQAAAKHADLLVITSDNPRNEDPNAIIDDIVAGLTGCDTEYVRIENRRDAINWAVTNAKKDDIIVLAGKGHEDYQILADNVKIHFDEREVVRDALESIK
ncbi:MAG: UDP-N-acetylmuramoyl-L-alanyl-D-glutamate--2,6-diaminopimelate ligase [Oscillospiraceae bacterium]|nr:UDP-N-acetylmuramoyl-L-alanyl-D-glutamate--2,6-diaminopimelate ligase [Oscillospiraceae bacterium]